MVRTARAARRRKVRVAALAAATVALGSGLVALVGPASAAAAANTLTVQADQVMRPVTHVASGSLYGLANATQPTVALAQAIKPHTFVQMPKGGRQQPTGDISVVAPTATAVGAKLVNRLSDYYAGWPYQFSWSTWTPFITSQITAMKQAPYYGSISAYEPWNESDNTWNAANGTYEQFWTTTFRQIRSLDPQKPIQGPSFSDNISDMRKFLQNAVATNTVPDIIAWHELINSSKIAGDVATVRSIMQQLGISDRPIAIEEYAAPAEVGLPGPLVGYIAKFERLGIRDAELAFWNQSGTLGDLLTGRGGSPNAAYWLYTWYAAMSGNMVTTNPPAQTGIDGFAAVPPAANEVTVVAGHCNGACAVTVNGLHRLNLGSTVRVRIDQTVSLGRTVASSGPSTISTGTYTPVNGSITVPITMATNNAYRITVTPGSGDVPTTAPTTLPTTQPTTPPTTAPTTPPTTPPTGSGCRASVTLNQWNGGYVATVRVTAGSAAVNGWTVTVPLPPGSAVTSTWNAGTTGTTGSVSFRNVSYNGQIAAGGYTEFGFQGTGTGPSSPPTCSG